ncbi:hypothetical protein CP533_3320 [Ophiocordyceps camponoti-saundersi (nom. inval.)]|nr:hypothetical protein CP533_3320 [Ophiocordyceps camponoti-saundersi (nom. inval.)]
MAASYRLSDAESRQIFTSQILPAEVAASRPESDPKHEPSALLLVGQIGAGKSTLSPRLLTALQRGGAIKVTHLVADAFKRYHPAHASLSSSSSSSSSSPSSVLPSAATGPDARRWLIMAAEEVARRRGDVLVESASRYVEDFVRLAEIFAVAGYGLWVVFLAVPLVLSRLGIAMRYYGGSDARLTPAFIHDQSCSGILEAASFLEGNPALARRVLVLRRDGHVVFPRGGIVATLKAERVRRLGDEERGRAERELEILRTRFDHRAVELAEEIAALLRALTEDEIREADGDLAEVMPLEILGGTEGREGWNVLWLP